MQSSSLLPLVVFLALGPLASWAAEVSERAMKIPLHNVKNGACPDRSRVPCFRKKKPECNSDWQCDGEEKCCPGYCGRKCVPPVPIRNPVSNKPGKCPVINYVYLMIDPPDLCKSDSQCEGDYKCCKGSCGKVCATPVTP